MSAPLIIIDKRPEHIGPPGYHFLAGDTIGFRLEGAIGTVTWNFDDGSDPAEGADVTHVYTLGGQNVSYRITCMDSGATVQPDPVTILMGAPPE